MDGDDTGNKYKKTTSCKYIILLKNGNKIPYAT